MSDTPETDAEMCDGWAGDAFAVSVDFARRLERERDEARRLFESSKRARHSLSNACDHLERKLSKVLIEREIERADYLMDEIRDRKAEGGEE